MKSVAWAAIVAGIYAAATPAHAQSDPSTLSEAQKLRIHLPYVRAATDCFARGILATPEATQLARIGQIGNAALTIPKGYCGAEVTALTAAHDSLYGLDTGRQFFIGPYFTDLPRALGNRLRPAFERLAAAEAREVAARQQESARQEAEKRTRIDQAERAFVLLRDKMYECTTGQTIQLVASAEVAEVLATAAMTVCSEDVRRTVQAQAARIQMEFPTADAGMVREEIEKTIRKSVVATAVAAKAAMNTPRPPVAAATQAPPSTVVPIVAGPPDTAPAPQTAVPMPSMSATTECLRTIAKARQDKFVNREDLIKAMLDLCRPEIESAARTAFLKDDKAMLENLRDKALENALQEARVIVGK